MQQFGINKKRLFKKNRGSKKNSSNDSQSKHSTSLKAYVKNLPDTGSLFEIKEALEDLFEPCGKLLDVHSYSTHKGARKAVREAVMVFSSEEEADKATELTGSLMDGRHIIVSKHRQFLNPTSKTVTVEGTLCKEITEEDLWQLFSECGPINFIHIDPLPTHLQSVIHFKDEGSVSKALKHDGKLLKGGTITVRCCTPNDDKKPVPVFVEGLHREVQKDDLFSLFSNCGNIKFIKLSPVKQEGASQKATIFFMDEESALNAIKQSGESFKGDVYTVSLRLPSYVIEDHEKLTNPLYIAGISKSTKEEDLFFMFQTCGLFQNIKFLDTNWKNLRKCIIEFKEAEGVKNALALKDLTLHGHKLIISDQKDILLHEYPALKRKPNQSDESSNPPKGKKVKTPTNAGSENEADEPTSPKMKTKKKGKKVKTQINIGSDGEVDEPTSPKIKKKKKAKKMSA